MITRSALALGLLIVFSGCGHKEPPAAPAPAKAEKGVSIENQAPVEPPPPTPVSTGDPAASAGAPPAAPDGEADNLIQKRYNRNMDWLRALKMGDEKKKQETVAAIKKAKLSAKERAEFEELKAHYNVQYPVQY